MILVLAISAYGIYFLAQVSTGGAAIVGSLLLLLASMVLFSASKLDAEEGAAESLAVAIGIAIAAAAGMAAGSIIALVTWQGCVLWGYLLDYDGDAYCRVEWVPWLAIGVLIAEAPLVVAAWPELRKWVIEAASRLGFTVPGPDRPKARGPK
jgi:hypothetical protein